jgi:DNA-binding transcriptional regulator YiaG
LAVVAVSVFCLTAQSQTLLPNTMITGTQIRVARALLQLTLGELARQAKVGTDTVRRAERSAHLPRIYPEKLLAIQQVLEAGGCVFSDDGETVRRQRGTTE